MRFSSWLRLHVDTFDFTTYRFKIFQSELFMDGSGQQEGVDLTSEREVRGLSARTARGWLEDRAAGQRACTCLAQAPEGEKGWECLERLQGDR